MSEGKKRIKGVLTALTLIFGSVVMGHPINDYYKTHKNDQGMEARTVPPKMASLLVDEDYPEAIDVLKSLTTLKYLNYYGDEDKIQHYAQKAISAKGNYTGLLNEIDGNRKLSVFGIKKKGTVRKLIAVVQTKTQFILLIGKGRLTDQHIRSLPALSKEI